METLIELGSNLFNHIKRLQPGMRVPIHQEI
jgi:hypothetical protein